MTLLATPIFGIIARTQHARERLSPQSLHPWARNWLRDPDPQAWWIDPAEGIAIFQPDHRRTTGNGTSCLCIRGSLMVDKMQGLLDRQPGEHSLDTVLNTLLHYGSAALRQMRGQFALSYWDSERRVLTLARDHLGQRCLFIRTEPHHLIFCSELAPLLHSPHEGNVLNEEGVFWYLAFGTPPPGQSLVKNIQRVPAAHCWNWSPDAPETMQRYWSPLTTEAQKDVTPEFIRQGRETLELALRRRLSGQASAGLLLSGGVDSTFLAATARGMGVPLPSFTSAFEEKYGINETDYASEVCRWLDMPYHEVPVHAEQVIEQMDDVFLSAAEPCSAWAIFTHFQMLSKAKQLGINYMLSGLGADEVFGGYDHFRGFYSRYLRYARQQNFSPSLDPFDVLLLTESQAERRVLYAGIARFFDDKALRKGLESPYSNWQHAGHTREFYRECRLIKPGADVMEMMVAHECQHRVPDLLFANFEPFSRRLGIETGYPFLDPDVVQLACGLSITSRYRTRQGKFSLKLKELMPHYKYAMMKIAEDRVPQEIIDRPRKSLTAPFGQWLFQSEFSEAVLSRIQRSHFWQTNIVRPEYMNEILSKLVPGPSPFVFQLWSLFTLTAWYDRYIDPQK
jgi:asparagine synthase (glutamine-hydrolysing)